MFHRALSRTLTAALLVCWPAAFANATEPPAVKAPSAAATAHPVRGVDHVGLAVTDLVATTTFFTQVLGFEHFRSDPDYPSNFLRNGHVIVTLWRVEDPATAVPFDRRKNVGLHHLALAVDSFEALETVFAKVAAYPGVTVEFSPEALGGGPAKHAMFREPSGNRMELIHRPAP